MKLADLQRSLAASLTGPAPEEAPALDRARRALLAKRRRAAGHLLPRLRRTLGDAWTGRFDEHARGYNPGGRLHHVDDAWVFAETLAREARGTLQDTLRDAARDDLAHLRLRFTRHPDEGADRIRERRGPLLVLFRTPSRRLALRLPGTSGRIFFVRLFP